METFDAGGKNLIARLFPPIFGGEDLDLLRPPVARGLDGGANPRQIDDAVAHHAAVEEEVAGRHEPIADVMGEDTPGGARAGDLVHQLRIPPDVVDVDGDADSVAEQVADVECLFEG